MLLKICCSHFDSYQGSLGRLATRVHKYTEMRRRRVKLMNLVSKYPGNVLHSGIYSETVPSFFTPACYFAMGLCGAEINGWVSDISTLEPDATVQQALIPNIKKVTMGRRH